MLVFMSINLEIKKRRYKPAFFILSTTATSELRHSGRWMVHPLIHHQR
jgi:hypothetical protein